MTSGATFGDFLDDARRQLAATVRAPAGGEDLRDTTQSIRRVIVVLGRYARDIAAAAGTGPDQGPDAEPPWQQAAVAAHRGLNQAARCLTPPTSPKLNLGTRPSVGTARQMDGAAVVLQAGRELLDTHVGLTPDGTPILRTEWAPALTSPPVRRALLAEVADLAAQVAATSDQIAVAPGWRGAPGPRRALREASQRLRMPAEFVQAASQHEPVPAAQRELLRAFPGSALPPRRLPGHGDDIADLREGAIVAAQRIRRSAWCTATRTAPAITTDSLRHNADASTLTSYHCELLLRAAADRAAAHFPAPDASQEITRAADAAGRARASWLAVARTLRRITIETPDEVAQPPGETSDLALWTGRLTYADPSWTLASGPAHQTRPPTALAGNLADIRLLISAVHQTLDCLEANAGAEHDQLQAAARAGRILVPALSLPRAETCDPFIAAPQSRITDLLGVYRTAGQASAHAATVACGIAGWVGAPSRVLATARAATGTDARWRSAPHTIARNGPHWPGPLETSMRDLGVTSPWLLQRAIALDRASTQLIMDAAAEPGARRDRSPAQASGRSAATTLGALAAAADRDSAEPFNVPTARPEPPERNMQAAASLNLDAALDESGPDRQADDATAGPTAVGVRRRLRALAARSWSPQSIADETGIPAPLISSLFGRNPRDLSPDQRLAIANAYDKVWDRDPPARTRDQREACELARSLAASRGWAPPQAWDDAQIDRPDGRPSSDWKPRNRTSRRAVDIVEDAQFVRDYGGYRDADKNQIAMRLGVSRDQLDQAYCRTRRYAARSSSADAEAFPHGQASAQAEPREAEP